MCGNEIDKRNFWRLRGNAFLSAKLPGTLTHGVPGEELILGTVQAKMCRVRFRSYFIHRLL